MDLSDDEPQLADVQDVLQVFEEHALAPVNSLTDINSLPPPIRQRNRFLPPDDSADVMEHKPTDTIDSTHVSAGQLMFLRPPTASEPSGEQFYPYKRTIRNIKSDLLLLRTAASVPLNNRLCIPWKLVQEKMIGTEMETFSSTRLGGSFAKLIKLIDIGRFPWPADSAPSDVEEACQLVAKLKALTNVGLPCEKVSLLRMPDFSAWQRNLGQRRRSRQPDQRHVNSAPVLHIAPQVRPQAVEEELAQRSQNIEDYLTGNIGFIPNVGSWRAKYISSEQVNVMEVLAQEEGNIPAAAAVLGLTTEQLEAQLDEWILERKQLHALEEPMSCVGDELGSAPSDASN